MSQLSYLEQLRYPRFQKWFPSYEFQALFKNKPVRPSCNKIHFNHIPTSSISSISLIFLIRTPTPILRVPFCQRTLSETAFGIGLSNLLQFSGRIRSCILLVPVPSQSQFLSWPSPFPISSWAAAADEIRFDESDFVSTFWMVNKIRIVWKIVTSFMMTRIPDGH